MRAQFLLGPAGSGKTRRCLEDIRAELSRPGETLPLLLLAPKQATFQLERQLLAPGLPGFTRLQILSFDRLAQFIVSESAGAEPRLLAEEGRLMVLRALLARHQDKLQLFHASARLPGFARQLNQLLREIQRHQLSPEKLLAVAGREKSTPGLAGKLHDAALLLRAYLDWLTKNNLHDADCLLDLATNLVRASAKEPGAKPSLAFAGLWLDGFAEMTPQEEDLLAAIIPFCEHATLAFCLDTSADSSTSKFSPWSPVRRVVQNCRERLAQLPGCEITVTELPRGAAPLRFTANPALGHLEKNWGRLEVFPGDTAPALRVVTCANPEAEAHFAAREIRRFVRADPARRFRDVAVLVRSLADYAAPLRRAFARHEIPCFLDQREPVAHHPLAELTRCALRVAAFHWQPEDWFGALKSGFAGAGEDEIDWLENAALEFGWKGGAWLSPLSIPDDDALTDRLEKLRRHLVPPFEALAARVATGGENPDGVQLAEAIRVFWKTLRVAETLEDWSAAVPDAASGGPSPAVHQTVWRQMQEWLDNLVLAFTGDRKPLREWLPILDAGLGGLTVGVIPPSLDQVLIGAIDRSRNPELRLAFILGVNESVFPAPPAPPVPLTEFDREALAAHGLRLGPDRFDQIARERYLGYIACTRARENLVLTYAQRDTADKPLNPSTFIGQVRQLFPKLEIENAAGPSSWLDAEHPRDLIAPLLQLDVATMPDALRQFAAAQFGSPLLSAETTAVEKSGVDSLSPSERERVRVRGERQRDFTGADGMNHAPPHPGPLPHPMGERESAVPDGSALWPIPRKAAESLQFSASALARLRGLTAESSLSPALAEQLHGPGALRTSVSQLEQFAACPFKFFVHAGMRAEQRKQFELGTRERGSFQHEVLAKFHQELVTERKLWRDVSVAEARARVGRIAEELSAGFRDGLFRSEDRNLFTAKSLATVLQDFIGAIIGWMAHYRFDPRAVELAFGRADAPLPAWELDLGGGHRLVFRGQIDRVDLAPGDGGAAWCVVMDYKSGARKVDALLLRHGIQMQLPAYLAALRAMPHGSMAAGEAPLQPAGFFYLNLRGDFERGEIRDEVLGDTESAAAYRHTGRFNRDALPQLDAAWAQGGSGQFNFKFNKDGSSSRVVKDMMAADEFHALLDEVETVIREMGRKIFAGDAQVDPFRKGQFTACEHCDFQSVCRIDPWTHSWRVLKKPEARDG
ncbi:MAG: PD-(D/E)XK nuclease family protein [Verrucomicrobia bacterium]|nr:PD-(D/E)XK nuclease family protein [Verrucomicrobiota bacterium]